MPKRCVVPNCDTGTRRCKNKYSVFKVTTDESLRKKWAAAIPGVVYLKPSQHVCERHFEEKFIERKWIKRDWDGKIIASVPYKRIRLVDSAVPSIFDNMLTQENMEKNAVSNNNDEESMLGETDTQEVPNLPLDQGIDREKQQESVHMADHCYCSTTSQGEKSRTEQSNEIRPSATAITPVPIATENNDTVENVPETEAYEIVNLASSEVTNGTNDQATSQLRLTPEEPMESLVTEIVTDPTPVVEESPNIEPKSTAVPVVHFTVVQEVQVHFWTDSALSKDNSVTTLPSTWCATALPGDETLVISQVCTTTENRIPVLRKSLTITSKRAITYFVHGKVVEKGRKSFPQILESPESLPSIVIRFQSLPVCYGLGNVDISLARADVACKDNMNMWRDSNCILIAIGNQKRCNFCTKLRKILKQKEARYAKRGVVKRVSVASNPIDTNKLNIMRKKLKSERRQKNRTESRLTNLLGRLNGLQDELATVQNQSLKERLSTFDIQSTDEIALQEIISAAKKNPKGRRYSQEWLMLCMLMNVRSPSFYEFLRTNRIIPLPCPRTIGRYLAITNSNGGSDDRFSELLKNRIDSAKPTQRDGSIASSGRKNASKIT